MAGGKDFTSRPYGGEDDLSLITGFLADVTSASAPQTYLHPGNVLWGTYRNPVFDPRREVRLWEDGDGLAGFAALEEPDGVLMQVHPRLRGSGVLQAEMLDWAAGQTRAVYGERAGDELWTRVTDDDPRVDESLRNLGFVRDDAPHALKMLRELAGPLPDVAPPEGWTVREVGGEEWWSERVEIHREVWHPSRVTLEAYRRLREAPGYDPWLDLVAVAPDGTFGAYCICWFDPTSLIGLYEPVGTRPAYRRKGLGRTVMLEGLRRLRALGAGSAFVTALHGNRAAASLYESVGFRTVCREYLYGKKV